MAATTTEDGKQRQSHTISLLPIRFTKTLHLIRHGEGFHNVAGHIDHEEYKNEAYFDAHLTEKGWSQAEALGRHIQSIGLKPEVVIVPPLTRTLETAVGAFGSAACSPLGSSASSKPLMLSQTALPNQRASRTEVSSSGLPPFVAVELCREHLGVHPCDRRRGTSHYRQQFPAVDFSLVEQEHDVLWTPHVRESRDDIKARGLAFMQYLLTRPERDIAVVTHSSFLHFMLQNFGHAHSTAVQGELHRWYDNCEMRTVVLSDPSALAVPQCSLHFPGGALGLQHQPVAAATAAAGAPMEEEADEHDDSEGVASKEPAVAAVGVN